MKTNDRIRALTFSKISLASIIIVFIVSVLYTETSTAQGNRRGGEKGNGNWKERSNQPPGGERRNDVAMDRGNKGDWKKNDAPDLNRNRNYEGGNMNRGRNNDWKNNRRNDNPGTINRPGNDDWKSNRRNDNPGNINRPGNDDMNSRRRNDNPGNINRGGNDYRNMDRRGNDYRRNMYTRDRPGYRPVYQYDRRPVYNRYDPSWRYNYLPRRNSYFYHVPSTYFSISFGGFSYRYWDGVFYRPYNNLFTVCAPPVGIYINVLPVGYRRVYVGNYPYYYYNGTYYDQRGSNYYVVSPPLGAIVESLPDGYETVVIEGETYYVVDGAQYKPVVVENGEIWYEVIKAN